MRISTAAELGIRGMVYLAANYQNGPVPMGEICQEQKLPRQYMLKIFAALGRAGFVRGNRGRGGGYALARAPGEISILDIIQAIEGPLALNFCQNRPSQCRWNNSNHKCQVRPMWDELQAITTKKLGEFHLDRVLLAADEPSGPPTA